MPASIAVVIPAYNARAFVCDALASVAAQSRRPERIVVVDDGSTDDTCELVRNWSASQAVAVDLLRQPNLGVSAARNAGIRAAGTESIALLDADDLLLPDHLALLERGLAAQPDVVLCFGDMQQFDSAGILKARHFPETPLPDLPYDEQQSGARVIRGSAFCSLLPSSYIATCCSLFSRPAAERVGLFDESISAAEDRDFWLRLSRQGKFAYFPVVVGRVRRHMTNATHDSNRLRNKQDHFRVLAKISRLTQELGLSDDEKRHVRQALTKCADDLLYCATVEGIRDYLLVSSFLDQQGFGLRALSPRHALRAVAGSLELLPRATREHAR